MVDLIRKLFAPRVNLKADTPGALSVEFATFNIVDLDRDVTIPGAFGEQGVRIQSHGHNTSSWSIGKGTISESGDKAVMDGLLNLDMAEGKEAHASLKFDLEHGEPLQEWSYVFEIMDSDFGEHQGQQVRFLKRLKVFSVDPVFLGAGVGTRTTGVKSLDSLSFTDAVDEYARLVTEFNERVRSRKDFRGKEGRTLSSSNVAHLTTIAATVKDAGSALEQLIEDSTPKSDDSELLKAKLNFERIRSQLLGVN